MKKRLRNKLNKYKHAFHLENLIGDENDFDYSISYSGDLYMNHTFVTSFYEHPVEGGYYQNGKINDHDSYQEFLLNAKKGIHTNKDDDWLFNNGITNLMATR